MYPFSLVRLQALWLHLVFDLISPVTNQPIKSWSTRTRLTNICSTVLGTLVYDHNMPTVILLGVTQLL